MTMAAAASVPTPPGAPVLRRHGARQFSLLWTTPNSDGGSAITGYEVRCERDGAQTGWTALPAGTGPVNAFVIPEGRAGNLFQATAQPDDAWGDTGLRAIEIVSPGFNPRTGGRYQANFSGRNDPDPPILTTPNVLQQVQFRQTALFLNLNFAGAARQGRLGPQDLPADFEAHSAWAVQMVSTGEVWGPFYFRDDASKLAGQTEEEPYDIPWPLGQDYNYFVSELLAGDGRVRVIVYDPRPAGATEVFAYDTRIPWNVPHRYQVRAVNAQGAGAPSPWSDTAFIGVRPAPPSVLAATETSLMVWPDDTTSYTIQAPGYEHATAQVSIVAPRRGAAAVGDVHIEVGDCDQFGRFETSNHGSLNYIYRTATWTASAHTEAHAQVTLRAPSFEDALDYTSYPYLRITVDNGPHSDVVFLGIIDKSKGRIEEDGASHEWLLTIEAATMLRRASENRIVDAGRLERPLGDVLYSKTDLPVNHLRVGAGEVGPMLYVDEREWPTEPIHVQSSTNQPLTYLDVARVVGNSIEQGWQLAPDGLFHPLLNPNYPARVIDAFDHVWNVRVSGIEALAPKNRQFQLYGPEDDAQVFAVDARHYRVPDGETATSYTPEPEDYDHRQGQVIVEKEWYAETEAGAVVKMVRLLVLDPGGYGARYPLPALVEPRLARVSVLRYGTGSVTANGVTYPRAKIVVNAQERRRFIYRVQRNASGGKSPYTYAIAFGARAPAGVVISGATLSGTPALAGIYSATLTVTDADANAVTVPIEIRVAGVTTGGAVVAPGTVEIAEADEDLSSNRWYLTPSHIVRRGELNPATLRASGTVENPWVAQVNGGAWRSVQSGWRFAVRLDVIDNVPNPIRVTWSSFTPDFIGRRVDLRGYGGPAGSLAIVRMETRIGTDSSENVRLQYNFTALQSAAVEESMDGLELLREIKKGRLVEATG